jgi:hypothetical protein
MLSWCSYRNRVAGEWSTSTSAISLSTVGIAEVSKLGVRMSHVHFYQPTNATTGFEYAHE